jgi:hypothetical protein
MERLCEEAQAILEIMRIRASTELFDGWWKKTDCNKNPKALFVFGDNDIQKGCGGQAIIRYCANTHGIPTKKYPSYALSAYYTDRELEKNKKRIIESIEDLIIKFDAENYDVIYFPEDGLGTGLSKLDSKAPKTLKFLNEIILELFGIEY